MINDFGWLRMTTRLWEPIKCHSGFQPEPTLNLRHYITLCWYCLLITIFLSSFHIPSVSTLCAINARLMQRWPSRSIWILFSWMFYSIKLHSENGQESTVLYPSFHHLCWAQARSWLSRCVQYCFVVLFASGSFWRSSYAVVWSVRHRLVCMPSFSLCAVIWSVSHREKTFGRGLYAVGLLFGVYTVVWCVCCCLVSVRCRSGGCLVS